jgi:hypothetical protein
MENEVPIHNEYSHGMRALEYYAVNSKGITNQEQYVPSVELLGGAGHTGGQML